MRRIKLAFTLLLTMLVISSCSKGSDDGEFSPSGGNGSLKMTIGAMSPSLACEVIAASQDGVEVNTQFSSAWSDTPTTEVWAKQSSELVYFGKLNVAIVSSDKKNGMIEFDGTGKLDEGKPYEVYGLGCSWRRDGNELFYRTDLQRSGSFGTYFKVVGQKGSVITTKRIAGTVEVLYVINKTDKVIKFKHKGFDAEKKWYFTHAEVSIDKGTVVNTEQGAEVAGENTNIPAFTGKNARGIYSYYVPNGNMIKDAQLIAEIDGKEVRSENRISSDITLQTDHAYGIFAVWDGEKLTLGDGNENGVIELEDGTKVYNVSTNTIPDVEVVSMDQDSTITMKTTEDRIPKVGDFLVSDVIEGIVPHGFIRQVSSVDIVSTRGSESKGIIATIKTTKAYLNQIFKTIDLDPVIPINEFEIDKVEDSEGNSISFIKEKGKIKLPEFKKSLGIFTVSTDIEFTPRSIQGHLHIKDNEIQQLGVDLTYKMEGKIKVKASSKVIDYDNTDDSFGFRKNKDVLCKVHLKNIKFTIAGIPVVITPYFRLYLRIKAKGEISGEFVPIYEVYDMTASVMYNRNDNDPEGKNCYTVTNTVNSHEDYNFYTQKYVEMKAELNTNFYTGFDANLSFGLDGSNAFEGKGNFGGIAIGLVPYVSYSGNMSLSYVSNLATGESETTVDDACRLNTALGTYADFYIEYFNPIKMKIGKLNYKPELDIVSWGNDFISNIFSGYDTFVISSTDARFLKAEANKHQPLFRDMIKEDDFGFCYAVDDKGLKNWTLCSLANNYKDRDYLRVYPINYYLDTQKLAPGLKYVIRPYTKVTIGETPVVIMREGKYFMVGKDGALSVTSLPDVPVTDL